MFSKNVQVSPLKISAGVDALLNFVSQFQTKVVLIGHNIKSYDCHLLLNALESCKRTFDFSQCIAGFVDTKLLFKIFDGTLNCYSQESLFKHFVSSKYNAHDAIEDVLALQKLIGHVDIDVSSCSFSNASFTFLNAIESHRYSSEVRKNVSTLNHLITENVVSKSMANKIAGSGLDFRCLQLAYRRDPHDGIQNLLSENVRNGVRVTKSQKVIFALNKYFVSTCEV
jgi:DNA polymerase III alpha subunit (gram-positive type)